MVESTDPVLHEIQTQLDEQKRCSNRMRFLVCTGDQDRLYAALLTAVGAVAMGYEVHMFFAYFGISAIRKKKKFSKKDLIQKAVSLLLPSSIGGMPLSKLQLFGLGPILVKLEMHLRNLSNIEELLESAVANGVKLHACSATMLVLGLTTDELLDGVEPEGITAGFNPDVVAGVNFFV